MVLENRWNQLLPHNRWHAPECGWGGGATRNRVGPCKRRLRRELQVEPLIMLPGSTGTGRERPPTRARADAEPDSRPLVGVVARAVGNQPGRSSATSGSRQRSRFPAGARQASGHPAGPAASKQLPAAPR